jgi:hypothetical protein
MLGLPPDRRQNAAAALPAGARALRGAYDAFAGMTTGEPD